MDWWNDGKIIIKINISMIPQLLGIGYCWSPGKILNKIFNISIAITNLTLTDRILKKQTIKKNWWLWFNGQRSHDQCEFRWNTIFIDSVCNQTSHSGTSRHVQCITLVWILMDYTVAPQTQKVSLPNQATVGSTAPSTLYRNQKFISLSVFWHCLLVLLLQWVCLWRLFLFCPF